MATSCQKIEQIKAPATKQAIARKILEGLRDWFEVDESREKYILDCADWTFLAAKEKDEYSGFLCLKETGKDTVELAVMGVKKEFHRKGLGRKLFEAAKKIATEKGYSFMQVKTVQMGVYPDYDITNRFYQSCGFKELEVIKEIWGEENPCQIYVMSLKRLNKMVTKKEFKDTLIKLGVKKGMTLEVHSSLGSFGKLEGGAETVIDTLKEIITCEGSIFMPALRLSKELPLTEEDKRLGLTVKIKILPPEAERTAMGIIADTFKRMPGVFCGPDFIATAGWGKHGEEAAKGGLNYAIHNGGMALLLGVDIYKLTAMHYVEDCTPDEIKNAFASSEEVNKIYPPNEWFTECGHPPVKAWYTIQKMAYEKGLIKETMIGNCKAMFFNIWDVVSIYREELERAPFELWGMKNLSDYLKESDCIDYTNPLVAKKAAELKAASSDTLDYVERAYNFVRDEIPHTWDAKLTVVSKKASDVLKNKTGICWTKSCLLAALLRANKIPAGISYQYLTRADDASDGYIIHALNTVYIDSLQKWIRLDARGNKPGVNAQFSLEKEILAFPTRPEFGEKDYRDNHSDLDVRLKEILIASDNILEVRADFEM